GVIGAIPVRAHYRGLPQVRGVELEPARVRIAAQPVVLALPTGVRSRVWSALLHDLRRLLAALVELLTTTGLHLLGGLPGGRRNARPGADRRRAIDAGVAQRRRRRRTPRLR